MEKKIRLVIAITQLIIAVLELILLLHALMV